MLGFFLPHGLEPSWRLATGHGPCYALAVLLSITIITLNEERNIGPTLDSVRPLARQVGAEIIVVDSRSTDRTVEIARAHGAKVFVEDWKGYGTQKNSAIEKAAGDWILSLDADEMVSPDLAGEIQRILTHTAELSSKFCATEEAGNAARTQVIRPDLTAAGFFIPRKNLFLSRWIKHGGFWPDRKLRLFRRDAGRFEERPVHETVKLAGLTGALRGALIHNAYPTLSGYIRQMNRYSSLGAEVAAAAGKRRFSFLDIVVRPKLTFLYNYLFRLGFLDGREGLLLHLYHAAYVSWKYAKAWELGRRSAPPLP